LSAKPTATSSSKSRSPRGRKSEPDAVAENVNDPKLSPVKPKRTTSRSKTAPEAPAAEAAAPKPAARSRARKAQPAAETQQAPATKPKRASRAKAAKVEPEALEAPAPRRKATRAAKPASTEPDETAAPRKRTRTAKATPRAAPEPQPPVAEEAKSEATEKPKPRRTTKTPTKRQTSRKVDIVEAPPPASISVPVEAAPEPEQPAEPETPSVSGEPAAHAPEPEAERPRFADLGLSEPIMRAIQELGYEHPTPIQAAAIPEVITGHDVLGVAQTGTGKTASFTLPMLENLSGSRARARMPRSLILEPTRELALQVADNFKLYGKHLRLTHALLIGGGNMAEQREILNRGVDVLIATPGRLLDLFERGGLLLNQTRILVIDEADRMLDMGFIPDIERIVSLLPPQRQTLFFSATMAPEIRRLADAFLRHPKEITVSRQSSVATTIEEALLIVPEDDKRRVLRRLLRNQDVQSAIVFCNRKRDVDTLYKSLSKHGFEVGALHGDLPQSVRFETLERFKAGDLKILVCSDVAARGIDIGGLSHVFNFDLPFNAEDYVHRIGRTGRAGKEGHAFSLASPYDRKFADAIEKLTGKSIAHPQIEGIATTDWSEDEAPPRHHKHGDKKNRRDRDRRPDKRDPERQAQTPRPERRPEPVRERSSAQPIPPFNENGPLTGFGRDTPAFMLLPRRRPVRVEAHGSHDGE